MSTTLLILALGTLPLPHGVVPEQVGYEEPRDSSAQADPSPSPPPQSEPSPTPLPATPTPISPQLLEQIRERSDKLVGPGIVQPTPPPGPAPAPVAQIPAAQFPRNGETTRYRVSYGLLGDLGEIVITFSPPDTEVRAIGSGSGSFLGLGKIEKRVEAQVLPAELSSRRWISTRHQSGKLTVDTVEQPKPGEIAVLRRRTGRPEEGHRFVRQTTVLDPLAFLFRLRSRPPERAEVFEVLDGRALWRISVEPTRIVAQGARRVLIMAGRGEPIFWDGSADSERTARSFKLYLEGDAQHTPLRLVMPMPVGEVQVDLTSVSHPASRAPIPVKNTVRAQGQPRRPLVKTARR